MTGHKISTLLQWSACSAAICLCLLFAHAQKSYAGSEIAPVYVTVSAATSLTDAFTELKNLFEAEHPNVIIAVNFAASGPLLRQMEMGAPVDVFASADEITMDKAAEAKLILDEKRLTFTSNSLVLIVPFDKLVNSLPEAYLTANTTARIAIGNPDSVPAGRYAKAALTSMGLWHSLMPKYVFAANVRQVLDYVSRGEVEAGILYATDVNKALASQKVCVLAKLSGHEPITYPIAPCINPSATPEQAQWAQAFIDFIMSAQGQEILARYGFGRGE